MTGKKIKMIKRCNVGHRGRLRQRFMNSPIRTLPDYEMMEMLLFNAFNRKDTKQLAKTLISTFGSIPKILNAEPLVLKEIEGIGDGVVFQFKLLLDLFSRLYIDSKDSNFHVLNNWNAVTNYCMLTMGFNKNESFRALFLNRQNILIKDTLISEGTVDTIAIYPREIVKQGVSCSASAIIIIHNHPSGDYRPSEEDIKITKKIIEALTTVSIKLHDHLIVSENGYFSFRNEGLI